jgi:hypothetical protein
MIAISVFNTRLEVDHSESGTRCKTIVEVTHRVAAKQLLFCLSAHKRLLLASFSQDSL